MSVWTGYTGAPCKELRRLQAGACGKRECQLEKGNMCGSKDLSQAEMRIIMKKYETVVFDLDGTLLNTLEDLADATNYALRTMQMPERTIVEVRAFVGNGVRRLMELSVPADLTIRNSKKHLLFLKSIMENTAMTKRELTMVLFRCSAN